MLITFKISNFLSFNEEVEFSMLAGQQRNLDSHVVTFGKGRNAIEILKGAAIYGANASGKSNFVKAIDFAKTVILKGIEQAATHKKHFLLHSENATKPSRFEFEFKLDDKLYAYGFSCLLNKKMIEKEWLYELGKTTNKVIFTRNVLENGNSDIKVELKLDKKMANRFEVYKEDILANQLFLSELNKKNIFDIGEVTVLKQVELFFANKLFIVTTSTDLKDNDLIFSFNTKEANTVFEKYLTYFNTGIDKIFTQELDLSESELFLNHLGLKGEKLNIKKQGQYLPWGIATLSDGKQKVVIEKNIDNEVLFSKILMQPKNAPKEVYFDIEEQSEGTQRLFDFIPILFSLANNSITCIIDEIDRSLHSELSHKLLESFFLATANTESQLIFTTHESSLLDLELLRRDEIWFTEKNKEGETRMYSLEEFKPRHDTELRKAYLMGRFGAIPFIADPSTLGWNV